MKKIQGISTLDLNVDLANTLKSGPVQSFAMQGKDKLVRNLLVSSVRVNAASMFAGVPVPVVVALVDVDVTVGAVEAGPTSATVPVPKGGTGSSVPTGLAGTIVRLLAIRP